MLPFYFQYHLDIFSLIPLLFPVGNPCHVVQVHLAMTSVTCVGPGQGLVKGLQLLALKDSSGMGT